MVNFHFTPTLEVFNNWFKENSEWNNFSYLTAAAVSGNIKRDYNHRFLGGTEKKDRRAEAPLKGSSNAYVCKTPSLTPHSYLTKFCLMLALYWSVILLLRWVLSVRSTVNETLMKECKWGGELAGKERGKCSEEGHDLKENISDRQKKQKMCLWSRYESKYLSHVRAGKANTA